MDWVARSLRRNALSAARVYAVALVALGDPLRRNADVYAIGVCTLRYDGAGPNDATTRNLHAIKDACVRADPHVVLDGNAVAITPLVCNQVSHVAIMKIVRNNHD